MEAQCALASLNPWQPSAGVSSTPPQVFKRVSRPETLERICSSWNKGRCVFPGSCRFRHVCATCRRKGHRAKECEETPADSPYKATPGSPAASKSTHDGSPR